MTGAEATAVSAVVSGILKIVGNKLAPPLIKKYSSIVGVKKDLEELHILVEEINSWLEWAQDQDMGDDASLNWLKQLKDVAYAVDDVVDEFQLKAERNDAFGDDGVMSKYMHRKPKLFIFQCQAANKIKAIKKRFAAIVKQRTDINIIANSLPGVRSVRHMNKTALGLPLVPNVGVASVFGRKQEKHQIISKLVETSGQQKTIIVSIIGLGGSGKSTLAKLVFNDRNTIAKHFDVRLWVHVSQEFNFDSIVGKLFEAIADDKSEYHNLQHMVKRISDKLTEKMFLLVLDDVWTKDRIELEQLMTILESGGSGSRILLTTRNRDVAEAVDSAYLFNLPFLSLADSWQLFMQSFGKNVEGLDSEFLEVGNEIINKCGGVPLAIKVIAGVLRDKRRIEEWQCIRDSNLLDVEGEEHRIYACLKLSYLKLPSHFKQCFTICSLFPKGHKIDKEKLIDLWIAHDMICAVDGLDYLEFAGHECFNFLIHKSFLQDVEENYCGRVTCMMHDLLHDLAQYILRDEISLAVPKDAISSTKSYRYFSFTEQAITLPSKTTFEIARAIYVHKSDDRIFGNTLKNAKHLRSITMEFNIPGTVEEVPNAIFQVQYLKYLEISRLKCEALPEAISDLWTLQALHVTSSDLLNLPKTFGKLMKLRTLNLSWCQRLKGLPDSIGDCQKISSIGLCNCKKLAALPNSVGKLQKLTTLNLSHCEELKSLPDSIGTCHMLSSIDLRNCKELIVLPSSITTLKNLECLDLHKCQELVELPEGIGNLEKLQVLNLEDCKKLGGMPLGIGLSRLQKLGLFVVGKGEKFAGISELANVPRICGELTIRGISHRMNPDAAQKACLKQKTCLQRLDLQWSSQVGEVNTQLVEDVIDGLEPPSTIEELSVSLYSGRQYARWMQNQVGARVHGPAPFPCLRVMKLADFPNLKNLHGLVELSRLEELNLHDMPCLESISGGPFPSLVKLMMSRLPCLGEVWMVAEGTMPDGEQGGGYYSFTPQLGQVQVSNCLTQLVISDCPTLEVKPHLPQSLQHLVLKGSEQLLQSPGQCQGSSSSTSFSHLKKLQLHCVTGLGSGHGWELLQHMMSLKSLDILGSFEMQTELPNSLWSLTSLQSLEVNYCCNIRMLPESLGELQSLQELTITCCNSLSSLPQSMGQLTSLQKLEIRFCDALHQLPDCLGELCSLRRLNIAFLPGLTCLPQFICHLTTSLQELYINTCLGIKSLPEGIKDLTALKQLWIRGCPDLERRCERGKGEDWHLISHIPQFIGTPEMDSLLNEVLCSYIPLEMR